MVIKKLETPRGVLNIRKEFNTPEEANAEGYYIYFSHDELDIYTKHIGEYSCHFATVNRKGFLVMCDNLNKAIESKDTEKINSSMDNCESQCSNYHSCDTIAIADDTLKELERTEDIINAVIEELQATEECLITDDHLECIEKILKKVLLEV